jgi:TatD DNase family protein
LRLIDTHCHLNLPDCYPDPEPEFHACREAGIGLILVGVDPKTSRRAVELAETHEDVWAIVGRHPNYAHEATSSDLSEIRELLSHPKAVALGEIGLDFHWDFATRDQQERSLFEQLDLASEVGVPVVFHCREAYPELLEILETRLHPTPMLFHCFAGAADQARRALDLGCAFGVDGPLTYKKADALRAIVRTLPRNRVVLETDSPYLTPSPHRGKPNSPTYLPLICAELAALWEIGLEEAGALTTANTMSFFRL